MKKSLILTILGIIFLVNASLVTGITDYKDDLGSTVDGVIHSNPSADNKIAITLDVDGSNLDMDLITLLIYNNIPITLFVNTKYLAANKETFLQLKLSHPDLVEFENHGAEHKACILGTEKVYGQEPAGTVSGMTKEIKDAADAIQTALGVTTKYYRPGTGAADAACVETVKGLGHSVVDWSVNGDHGAGSAITAETIKNDWLSVQAGGIIVSHLNKPHGNTYEGAKEAISLLKKKGFTFVKLEELLGYTSSVASTSSSSASSYRFVVISDTHLESANIKPAIEKIISLEPKPNFVIHTGDMIMDKNGPENTVEWEQVKTEIITPLKGVGINFFPVRGNHDAGFKKMFVDQGYIYGYYYALENNDKFLFLDGTGLTIEKTQLNWLKDKLANAKEKYQNIFVFSHEPLADLCEPAACTGQLNPNDELVILFNDAGVTIFFNGHQHFYDKVNYKGINIVSSGYLAGYQYTPKSTSTKQKPTFVVVDVNGPNDVQVSAYQKLGSGEFEYVPDGTILSGQDINKLGPDFKSFSLADAATSTPTKGASLSAEVPESIFSLNFEKYPAENLQFKYDLTENQWLVSAVCNLKKSITPSPEETSDFIDISKFLGKCEDTNLNVIITDAIFSGTESFEEGKEALCSYYAENSIKQKFGASLWIDEKKILPLTNVGGTEEELRLEITESCLDQMYMATEGSVAAEEIVEEHEDLSEIGEGTQEIEGTAQAPNSQLCEIDSVWIAAGTSLNIEKAVKTLIFTLTGWRPFDDVCKPKAPATAAITTPNGKKYAWSSQYDSIINSKLTTEMKNNGFDLNLIKALISRESSFQSQVISTAGCIGLMQICYTSVPSATPAYQKTTCCEAGEDSPKQTCTSEVKQTKHLWQEGVYKCTPNNDDRFDPERNIAMGLELLSKKYAQCNSVNGALSAYASGSCSSRSDYAETIQSIKNSHKN